MKLKSYQIGKQKKKTELKREKRVMHVDERGDAFCCVFFSLAAIVFQGCWGCSLLDPRTFLFFSNHYLISLSLDISYRPRFIIIPLKTN